MSEKVCVCVHETVCKRLKVRKKQYVSENVRNCECEKECERVSDSVRVCEKVCESENVCA